jgi:hypothetical protein
MPARCVLALPRCAANYRNYNLAAAATALPVAGTLVVSATRTFTRLARYEFNALRGVASPALRMLDQITRVITARTTRNTRLAARDHLVGGAVGRQTAATTALPVTRTLIVGATRTFRGFPRQITRHAGRQGVGTHGAGCEYCTKC